MLFHIGHATQLRHSLATVRGWLTLCMLLAAAWLLGGCASEPRADYTQADTFQCLPGVGQAGSPARQAAPADQAYSLHIIEFDDQGWPYPKGESKDNASPSFRIDCAIADIARPLEAHGQKVLVLVYVHGWHHAASPDDADLAQFRKTLQAQVRQHGKERKVIGIYVGWNGAELDLPLLKWTTLWRRKNAAHHVAEGSVRELFARIHTLRNRWNRNKVAEAINIHTCKRVQNADSGPDCPIRTIMVGHSFGAWILYVSTAPYVIQTLAAGSYILPEDITAKIRANADAGETKEYPDTDRERGIADLIVLLNPAFEATRYNAVFNAALTYRKLRFEPPLLVTVTSEADQATRTWFPIARTISTIFQHRPLTSLERQAMLNTHGHVDRYLTHALTVDGPWLADTHERDCVDAQGTLGQQARALRRHYQGQLTKLPAAPVQPVPLERQLCGGMRLTWLDKPNANPFSIVWNIRTVGHVIPNHSDIHMQPMNYLLTELYEDMGALPRFDLAGLPGTPALGAATSPGSGAPDADAH